MLNGFTSTYDHISNRLINYTTVKYNDKDCYVKALWDTGATTTCISHNVVQKLSLISVGKATMSSTSGKTEVNTYLVDIDLPNDVHIKDVKVCDSEIAAQGFDLLIGMDIINRGDFSVSNCNGKTIFTFRIPSIQATDAEISKKAKQ